MRARGVAAALALLAGPAWGGASPRAAAQPVPFSHRVHAGDNQIGCLLCHAYARHSPVAGIPSMQRCFGCHKFVARDKQAVQLVDQTYRDGKVLEWNRVYRLPDHVFFTHERHLAAGLSCQSCHGDVGQMSVLVPASSLTMGWCVNCHRDRSAPIDCILCHK